MCKKSSLSFLADSGITLPKDYLWKKTYEHVKLDYVLCTVFYWCSFMDKNGIRDAGLEEYNGAYLSPSTLNHFIGLSIKNTTFTTILN